MIGCFGEYCLVDYYECVKKEDSHSLIDLYEYRCEKEDKVNLEDLEDRIQKLEKE